MLTAEKKEPPHLTTSDLSVKEAAAYAQTSFHHVEAATTTKVQITNERIETEELETHDGLNDRAKVCTTACAI